MSLPTAVDAAPAVRQLREAVAHKIAVLVDGVAVDPAIEKCAPFKVRTEHLYRHHDRDDDVPAMPQEFILYSDPVLTRGEPVIANVRYNSRSAWSLTADGTDPVLLSPDGVRIPVQLTANPGYYSAATSSGTPLWRVAQSMGTDMIGVIPHNYCIYFARGDQCRFCEIVPNYVQAKTYPSARKSLNDQVEAIVTALKADPQIANVVITAGNHRTNDETADLYVDLVRTVRGQLDGRDVFIFGSLMAPETPTKIDELRAAGFDALGFNIEVWRPDAFERMAPGKAKHGRVALLEALARAVRLFPTGQVYSNMPYGVQSLDEDLRGSSYDPATENELSLEADRALLDMGVVPLHTLYHTAGENPIGPITLSLAHVEDFFRAYAELVHGSGLIADTRSAIFGNLGSITNHPYNDAFVAARAEAPQLRQL